MAQNTHHHHIFAVSILSGQMSVETRNFYPDLERHVTPTASGSQVVSYVHDLGPSRPILTLIHGYPQSSLIWRYIVPQLKQKASLFIPELPGYGISTPSDKHSKLEVGRALLEALISTFKLQPGEAAAPRTVILGGHDRGARIAHRLAVSLSHDPAFAQSSGAGGGLLRVAGAALLDIVPTQAQWAAFADPVSSRAYFHWPLLANVALAVPLIRAYGGARWCRQSHALVAGSDEAGRARVVEADGAADVHAELFEREETIRCSCEDYAAGSTVDVVEQVADQAAGRKLDVPTLVLFSAAGIGGRMDVAGIWKDWVAPGVELEAVAVGGGYGHYLPEEACDDVLEHLSMFLKSVA
ncbi:hypothetical protein GGTG_08568 [Gaeumannomyces tritici R3-111a-1]|uniref:AB hydrolase-1 domain-containing protein n=1 Tax=Gaeumannomyces tritici (strain R3-111a-1) TaxID=644352 RepID=J3P4Y2_GAET3|nr:hypothetical protein GGTG_08568 [Gaeumannomyces tritici R3-111a-1]EJT74730.1 hypothetical protein GGTG_08568 [Gaeumannomyces tritici R3-111a-1]